MSKQTNGPRTTSASDFAQREACFDLHKQTSFAVATEPKYEARNRIRIKISRRNAFVFFQVQGDSPFLFSTFISVDNPKGTF